MCVCVCVCLCVWVCSIIQYRLTSLGSHGPHAPFFPVCTDISTASDNKIWFSCLFWCDAIVVWANSRGLYKGKLGHLKCQTAAVAEAQEFPFRRGSIALSVSEHPQHMCTAEGAIKLSISSPSSPWNLSSFLQTIFQAVTPSFLVFTIEENLQYMLKLNKLQKCLFQNMWRGQST